MRVAYQGKRIQSYPRARKRRPVEIGSRRC
jgi:hypothetical protein